jgi:hypothetical protein
MNDHGFLCKCDECKIPTVSLTDGGKVVQVHNKKSLAVLRSSGWEEVDAEAGDNGQLQPEPVEFALERARDNLVRAKMNNGMRLSSDEAWIAYAVYRNRLVINDGVIVGYRYRGRIIYLYLDGD